MRLVVLFSCLSMVTAAQLCGGFALVSALEAYGQLKDRAEQRVLLEPVSPQSYFNLRERIGKINAFTSYEALSACIMVALEITLVLMYTFLSVTGEQLLTCMLLSVGCTLLAQEAADFVLRRRERRQRSDPTVMMLIGLFLWMYSLVLFGRTMESGTPPVAGGLFQFDFVQPRRKRLPDGAHAHGAHHGAGGAVFCGQ